MIEGDPILAQQEKTARDIFESAVSIPAIVATGILHQNHHYLIMEYVAGASLSSILVGKAQYPIATAFEEAGNALGLIHQASNLQYSNKLSYAPLTVLEIDQPDFTDTFIQSANIIRNRFGAKLYQAIVQAVKSVEAFIGDEPLEQTIIHGDYQPKNLIFSESGKISSIIDWELMGLGHPLSDLAQILRYAYSDHLEDSLTEGYAAIRPLPINWRIFARYYDLVRVCSGLSRNGTSEDALLWLEFVWGCAVYLHSGNPDRVRKASKALLALE